MARPLAVAALTVGFALVLAAGMAAGDEAPAGDLHKRISQAYMAGEWSELDKALKAPAAEHAALTADQKADVAYIRAALAECRPAWWEPCKAGRKGNVSFNVFGRTFAATFDPAAKSNIQMSTRGATTTFTLCWPHGEMDSEEKGLYGFLKGDQACTTVWGTLGEAAVWTTLPMQQLAAAGDRDKLRLQRYMVFRGNLTSLYYSTPPARRYALHIYFAAFMDKYGKGPLAGVRRAACGGVMAEFLADPARYPSLKLPGKLEADDAEKTLGTHFKMAINRGAHWTIAEDRAFRTAIKAFAAANDKPVLQAEKVTLANKLVFHFDDEQDAALRPKRDAWFKEQYDKAKGK